MEIAFKNSVILCVKLYVTVEVKTFEFLFFLGGYTPNSSSVNGIIIFQAFISIQIKKSTN